MTGEAPRSAGANRADERTTEQSTGADAEDRTLLERLRAGEDAAFGALFSRHSTAVFRLALGLVNDRAEAEDLTAEAFFRVLQAIRRGSGPVDNVRGYLLIVARRVAWEWSLRRKDVPVSDEELTHRAVSDPDTSGQFTERNLIRRAFTSLPERWRNVLWKMEVEGERPAAVATNFGLSPNATAALARRARQGLRAAYLQAHLAADRSATGCRSVLEKLGAYTAGSTSGIERRRIRAHLQTCASCTAMHAELRDVCSGLRAHASYLTAPVALVAGAGLTTQAGGLGASVKSLLVSTKIQIAITAGSAAAIGVLGFVAGPWDGDGLTAPVDLAGKRAVELHLSDPSVGRPAESSLRVTGGELTTQRRVPPRERPAPETDTPVRDVPPTSATPALATTTTEDGSRLDSPMMSVEAPFDETAPIVYRETRVERQTTTYDDQVVVYETTTVTEVNTLDQRRTTTESASYTRSPSSTPPPSGGQQTARTAEPTVSSTAPDGP